MSSLLALPVLRDVVVALCVHCTPPAAERTCFGPDCSHGWSSERRCLAALASLSRTCRALNDIATPFLYHRPRCGRDGFISLTRTVLRRPEIAHQVRHLYEDDWYFGGVLDPEDVRLFQDAAARFDVADLSPNWLRTDPKAPRGYDRGVLDQHLEGGLVGLLAAHCPNLEELLVKLYYSIIFPFSQPGTLPRLETLHLVHGDHKYGASMGNGENLFTAAPNLQRFAGWQMDRMCDPAILPTTIRDLDFQHSTLNANDLESLLGACPLLEKLQFTCACTENDMFRPRELHEAFQRSACAPRLRTLKMDLSGALYDGVDPGDELRSLAALTALEELELDTSCLFPRDPWGRNDPGVEPTLLVELLPSSVRSFRLAAGSDCVFETKGLFAALQTLAGAVPSIYPNLKTVSTIGLVETQVDEIKAAFAAHGVEFSTPSKKRYIGEDED